VGVAFARAKQIFYAGDDDQAIYTWAGADVETLLTLGADVRVLHQSYRLPAAVHAIAARVSERIKRRQTKAWAPTSAAGNVNFMSRLASLPLENGETWMLLARTAKMSLPRIAADVERRGLNYRLNGTVALGPVYCSAYATLTALRAGAPVSAKAARALGTLGEAYAPSVVRTPTVYPRDLPAGALDHDERLFTALNPGRRRLLARLGAAGRLAEPVKIDISTIHQAKGAEADNVVLSPDLSRATDAALRSPAYADSEHRVMYVGVSRARKRLFILRQESEYAYRFR
jgi:hypothetical protein